MPRHGVFAAQDLLLFYVFWEGMLVPLYILVGVWGGPRRIAATLKFVAQPQNANSSSTFSSVSVELTDTSGRALYAIGPSELFRLLGADD